MFRSSRIFLALAALLACAGALAYSSPAPVIAPHLERLASGVVQVTVPTPPASVIDRDTLALTASRGWAVHPVWPPGTPDTQGRTSYPEGMIVEVPVEAKDPTRPLQVSLTYRFCPVNGPCEMAPHTQTVSLPATLTQPTLVIVGTSWCPYCQRLAAKLKTPAVRAFLAGWQVVELDGDADREANQRLGVKGYPLLRVYAAGDVADTHHGTHSDGYPTDLIGFLKAPPVRRKPPREVASAP